MHHPHALVPVLPAEIGAANVIVFDMCELALDRIGVPFSALVEEAAGHRAEAVARHLRLVVAQPAQGGIDGVVGDGARVRPDAWEK